jgi:hypothetical protein
VPLGRAVEGRPGAAASEACGTPHGIDLDPVHRPHVDDEAVVAERHAGDRVSRGAHCDLKPVRASELKRRRDGVCARALGDQRGPLDDHRVEERPGLLAVGAAGPDDPPRERALEANDRALEPWLGVDFCERHGQLLTEDRTLVRSRYLARSC